VLHIDALLALGKDELEELMFDGLQLTGRSIDESLPVAGSPLRLDGSVQLLVPLGQKWDGHAKNFTGLADVEILLHTDPVALLHKHDLLEEGVPPAGLASQPPKRPEEEGARHRERVGKSFFDQINQQIWGVVGVDGWRTPAPFLNLKAYNGSVQQKSCRKGILIPTHRWYNTTKNNNPRDLASVF